MLYQATQIIWSKTKAIITIVVGLLMILIEFWVAKVG